MPSPCCTLLKINKLQLEEIVSAEDPSLVLSTHIRCLTTAWNSTFRELTPLLLPWVHTHKQIIKIKKNNNLYMLGLGFSKVWTEGIKKFCTLRLTQTHCPLLVMPCRAELLNLHCISYLLWMQCTGVDIAYELNAWLLWWLVFYVQLCHVLESHIWCILV